MFENLAKLQVKSKASDFGFFVQSSAEALGITGWIKNLNDGTVKMELQGKEKYIELLISKMRSGNNFIKVENLELSQLPIIRGEKSFEIRY